MSTPRPVLQAILDLKRAFEQQGMSGPFSMEFPDATYDKLMNGVADSAGMTRAKLDQQVAHGCGGVRIAGVEIKKF